MKPSINNTQRYKTYESLASKYLRANAFNLNYHKEKGGIYFYLFGRLDDCLREASYNADKATRIFAADYGCVSLDAIDMLAFKNDFANYGSEDGTDQEDDNWSIDDHTLYVEHSVSEFANDLAAALRRYELLKKYKPPMTPSLNKSENGMKEPEEVCASRGGLAAVAASIGIEIWLI